MRLVQRTRDRDRRPSLEALSGLRLVLPRRPRQCAHERGSVIAQLDDEDVEASDRRGDIVVADAIMRDARKKNLIESMLLYMSAFDLANGGLARLNRWVQKRDADTSAFATAGALIVIALGWGRIPTENMFGVVLFGTVLTYAVCWLTFTRRAYTRWKKPFRIGTSALIWAVVVGLGAFVMAR